MSKYAQKMIEIGARQLGIHEGYVFPPISEEKMTEVERGLGAELPEDYREFVRDYGFCRISDPDFTFMRKGQLYTSGISNFNGIAQNPTY